MKITRILPAALAALAVLAITAGSALAAGSTGDHNTHATPPAAAAPADKAPGGDAAPMQGCGCCQMMKDGHGDMGNMDAKPGGAGHVMPGMDGKAPIRNS